MPLSNERARELAQLEPPRSIERMIRFLADMGRRVPGLPPLTPGGSPELQAVSPGARGIGMAGDRARSFAARLAVQNNPFGPADPLQTLMTSYQVGVADVQQFTLWLAHWNDKRLETESIVIRDMVLARPPREVEGGDTTAAVFPRRRAQRRMESAGEADDTDYYESDAQESTRPRPARRRIQATETLRQNRQDESAEPDTLSRAWRGGREEASPLRLRPPGSLPPPRGTEAELEAEAANDLSRAAPGLDNQPASSLSASLMPGKGLPASSGAGGAAVGGLDPLVAAQSPTSTRLILERAVWGANLMGVGMLAGLALEKGSAGNALPSALNADFAPLGRFAEGGGALAARPDLDFTLSRPPLPVPSYLGTAAPPPDTNVERERQAWRPPFDERAPGRAPIVASQSVSAAPSSTAPAVPSLPERFSGQAPAGKSVDEMEVEPDAQETPEDRSSRLQKSAASGAALVSVGAEGEDWTEDRKQPVSPSVPGRSLSSIPAFYNAVAMFGMPAATAAMVALAGLFVGSGSASAQAAPGSLLAATSATASRAVSAVGLPGASVLPAFTSLSALPGAPASPGRASFAGLPAMSGVIPWAGLDRLNGAAAGASPAYPALFGAASAGYNATGTDSFNVNSAGYNPAYNPVGSRAVLQAQTRAGVPFDSTFTPSNLPSDLSGSESSGAAGEAGLRGQAGSPLPSMLRPQNGVASGVLAGIGQVGSPGMRQALPPAQIGMGYVDLLSGQAARPSALVARAPQPLLPSNQNGRGTFGGEPGGVDAARPPAVSLRPEMGQVTLIAPPLNVASEQAELGGVATAFDWQALAQGMGPLTESGWARLKDALPASAQIIYPALPAGGAGVNLPLAPALLGNLMGQGYAPHIASRAAEASRMGAQAASRPLTSATLPGRIVPLKAPMGQQAGLLDQGAAQSGEGTLAQAGGGQAGRGGALDFLGLPVRLAPSLSGKSELSTEVAARRGATDASAPALVRPQQFSPLRDRLFPAFQSVAAEMDTPAWEKSAPAYGLRNSDPTTLLSPDARLPAPTATSALPQMQGGEGLSRLSPTLDRALAAASPHARPAASSFASLLHGGLPGQANAASAAMRALGSPASGGAEHSPAYGGQGASPSPAGAPPPHAGANPLPGRALSPVLPSLTQDASEPGSAGFAGGLLPALSGIGAFSDGFASPAGAHATGNSAASQGAWDAPLRPFPTVSGLQNHDLSRYSGDMASRSHGNHPAGNSAPFTPISLAAPLATSAGAAYGSAPSLGSPALSGPHAPAPWMRGQDGLLPSASSSGLSSSSSLPALQGRSAGSMTALNAPYALMGHGANAGTTPVHTHNGTGLHSLAPVLNIPAPGRGGGSLPAIGHVPALPTGSAPMPSPSRVTPSLPAFDSGSGAGHFLPLSAGFPPMSEPAAGSAPTPSGQARPFPNLPVFPAPTAPAHTHTADASPSLAMTLPAWTGAGAHDALPATRAISRISEHSAEQSPTLTLPSMSLPSLKNGRGQVAVRGDAAPLVIQRVSTGTTPQSPAAEKAAQPPRASALGAGENQAKANEVHLLANEVWSLLKRRMSWEAERRGRW